jgi:hypothetical protein
VLASQTDRNTGKRMGDSADAAWIPSMRLCRERERNRAVAISHLRRV